MKSKRLRWVLRAIPPMAGTSGSYQLGIGLLDPEEVPEGLVSWDTREEAERFLTSGADSARVLSVLVEQNLPTPKKMLADRVFSFLGENALSMFHALGRPFRRRL